MAKSPSDADIEHALRPFHVDGGQPTVPEPSALRVPRRIEIDKDKLHNGLGQLVLTLVKLLHDLLEKQAIRRMESNTLTEQQIEDLGFTLMRQAEEIDRLRQSFGLEEADLNLDLGPLGKLL